MVRFGANLFATTATVHVVRGRRIIGGGGEKRATIDKVLAELTPKLYDKITTREIYRRVYELLSRYQRQQADRYSLKPALFSLGPSGYRFEKFIAD